MVVQTVLQQLGSVSQEVRRYFRGVLGADAYEKYLEYHRQYHPEKEPMTVKEFWRDKTDRQEKNPHGRCC